MPLPKRRRLAGFVSAVAVLLATALSLIATPAPALATTPADCFTVYEGKIHVNPACMNPSPPPATSMVVNLRARVNAAYVTAENAGADPIINNRPGVGGWERFGISMQSDGTVAIKALINGKYVSVANAGSGSLIANQTSIGQWEKFTVVDNANGSVSLRAASGNLVWANPSGAAALVTASTDTSQVSTQFDILTPPTLVRRISLRAHANNRYVSTASGLLIANQTGVGSTEIFNQYQLPGGGTALEAYLGGYVTADNYGASPLIANRAAIGLWETFVVVNNPDGSISLRASVNNRYVTAESAGASALIANRLSVGAWEEFDAVPA